MTERCICNGLKGQHGKDRRGRATCFHSSVCGCTTYELATVEGSQERHPAGKAIPEVPQTADIQDYLRQKGEIQ